MKSLLLCFLLVGCGSQFLCDKTVNVNVPPMHQPASPCTEETLFGKSHPLLQDAIASFSKDAVRHEAPCYYTLVAGMTDNFPKDLPESVIGYCISPLRVMIKTSFWNKASATERLTLVYHELGHCALGLDHYDTVPDIMSTYLLDESIAEKQWDKLVTNLFERAKK